MKPLTKYSNTQIHLFLIAFFLLMTMIGFELAMYLQVSNPTEMRLHRIRVRIIRRAECEEEEEDCSTIKLVAA